MPQLQQRSAGSLLAPPAGACCHETRLADRPLFPVERTSAKRHSLASRGWDATEHRQTVGGPTAINTLGSIRNLSHTTHMHIPLHIRKLLQRTSGLVVVTLDQVSKRIQCVLLCILQNIKCKQCACSYAIINCVLRQRAWFVASLQVGNKPVQHAQWLDKQQASR